MIKKSICGMTFQELSDNLSSEGYSEQHIRSVLNSVYKKGVTDISSLKQIPGSLIKLLSENFIVGIVPPVDLQVSKDNSIKYLFSGENNKTFETVYIPEVKRTTVCVSTQSGCRMGCSFCVTADYGFRGNLSAGEIVNQVISLPDASIVTHIVFMGMGEPLDNIENVLKACEIFTSEWGLSLSPRNITVSTVGIIDGVNEFLKASGCNLALSLHTPFSEERKKIIPSEKMNHASDIIELMKLFPRKKSRRFSVAYVMINGFNDTDKHLEGLKKLLQGSDIRVNILPFHCSGSNSFTPSSYEKMMYFKHNLVISGISASIRKSRGADISAACGLLAKGIN
jgi:23S rRNA (adenine2503-C2)-methyltransferase